MPRSTTVSLRRLSQKRQVSPRPDAGNSLTELLVAGACPFAGQRTVGSQEPDWGLLIRRRSWGVVEQSCVAYGRCHPAPRRSEGGLIRTIRIIRTDGGLPGAADLG